MNRPSIRRFTLVFLLALAFVSPMIKAVEVTPPAAPAPLLYVEDAASGSLTGPDDQHLKLKLKRMRRNITAISNGNDEEPVDWLIPIAKFCADWMITFPDASATAVLSYDLPGKSQPANMYLTITNPQYDAVKRTVEFDAVRVKHETTYQNPKANVYPIDIFIPFSFTDPTIIMVPFFGRGWIGSA